MGPKIFTVLEANVLIPKVDVIFTDLDKVRNRLKYLKNKVDVLEMLWGEEIQSDQNPDNREYQHYMTEVAKTKTDYETATRRLADLEVMLKSIESGLVDFYGVVDGRLVFLCWKRGEKSVDFYHQLEDGFSGRQPIPAAEPTK